MVRDRYTTLALVGLSARISDSSGSLGSESLSFSVIEEGMGAKNTENSMEAKPKAGCFS